MTPSWRKAKFQENCTRTEVFSLFLNSGGGADMIRWTSRLQSGIVKGDCKENGT